MAFGEEQVKELIDLLDEGLSDYFAAKRLGVTRNTIIGQRQRHGYGCGKGQVVDLAKKFSGATAEEIAEATGRDQAPAILAKAGINRPAKGISTTRLAAMRASLWETCE